MEVYKSKPNNHGWYWVIHKCKSHIKIFHKVTKKKYKVNENVVQVHGEGIKLLKFALQDNSEVGK